MLVSTNTRIFQATLLVLFLLLSLFSQQASAQCSPDTEARHDIEVMDHPPIYSTASGWTYGKRIATIPRGKRYRVCGHTDIGFFTSKQRWYRVEWDGRQGWVYSAQIRSGLFQRWYAFMISDVYAQTGPTAPPELFDPLTLGSFLFMVFGIVAKDTFDFFTRIRGRFSLRAFAKSLVVPLVVSPIVFLGIVRNVDLLPANATSSGMLALFLFAFQNGFFWQDVLPAPASGRSVKRPPA